MNRLNELKALFDKEYSNVKKSKNNGKSLKLIQIKRSLMDPSEDDYLSAGWSTRAGDQRPAEVEPRRPIMTIYLNAKVVLEELTQSLRPALASGTSNSMLDLTVQQPTGRSDHLPRIALPRFNGSPTEWLAFKARFEKRIATIGKDADKFAFLAKCLERFEPARNSVEALENSGSSFAEAWTKLENRFYKKRIAY